MRALNKGWIGIALVILFGASLFFFRGSSRYSNLFNSDNFVANISGTQVSTTQFIRSLEMNIAQFSQMIGEELNGDQIRAFQIHQLVLQNLTNNAIFENEFDDLKFILDESIIAEKTKKRFPNLYLNNKINDDALNSFLRQQRLKIEDLVNIIDYETRAVVFDELFFEKNYPKELANKIDTFNKHTRSIELLNVPFNKIKLNNLNLENISKDNVDLINFYEENTANYMSQEKRDISYLVLEKNKYKKNFIPNDNQVSNYFENNKKLYTVPEKRSFSQFNFKSKNEAQDFKLNTSGLSQAKIIEFASEENILFNNFEKLDSNQVLGDLSKVIFSLNEGEISDVVETTLAHHIIVLNSIIPEKQPKLNEVFDEIKDTLTQVELDNFYNDLKLKINQQILDGFSLIDIASKNNLFIENIKNVSQNDNANDKLKNTIVSTSFSQNKDFISDIYDFDENKSFIINVDNIYPSEAKNIDDVYNDVLSDFIRSKKLEYARILFNKYKTDSNLKKINSIFNLEIESKEIKIDSNDLPNSLLNNIFKTDLNSLTFSSDEANAYFVLISKINMPQKVEGSKINLKSELKNSFGNEIIKTKKISFNDELINGLLSQYK